MLVSEHLLGAMVEGLGVRPAISPRKRVSPVEQALGGFLSLRSVPECHWTEEHDRCGDC